MSKPKEIQDLTAGMLIEDLKRYPEEAVIEFIHGETELYAHELIHETHTFVRTKRYPKGVRYDFLIFNLGGTVPKCMIKKERK